MLLLEMYSGHPTFSCCATNHSTTQWHETTVLLLSWFHVLGIQAETEGMTCPSSMQAGASIAVAGMAAGSWDRLDESHVAGASWSSTVFLGCPPCCTCWAGTSKMASPLIHQGDSTLLLVVLITSSSHWSRVRNLRGVLASFNLCKRREVEGQSRRLFRGGWDGVGVSWCGESGMTHAWGLSGSHSKELGMVFTSRYLRLRKGTAVIHLLRW